MGSTSLWRRQEPTGRSRLARSDEGSWISAFAAAAKVAASLLTAWASLPYIALAAAAGAPLAMAQGRPAQGERPLRIYIAPDDHTDFMWTADEQAYEQAYLKMLDYYLDQADLTDGQPAQYRAKWNADGSHWFYVYEKYRSPTQMARLMRRVRDGSISLPLNTVVSTYGGVPTRGGTSQHVLCGRSRATI